MNWTCPHNIPFPCERTEWHWHNSFSPEDFQVFVDQERSIYILFNEGSRRVDRYINAIPNAAGLPEIDNLEGACRGAIMLACHAMNEFKTMMEKLEGTDIDVRKRSYSDHIFFVEWERQRRQVEAWRKTCDAWIYVWGVNGTKAKDKLQLAVALARIRVGGDDWRAKVEQGHAEAESREY
ncbi:hypothetical protein CC80DRAFT_586122 [Byssothecium circinans]|uniref:Uncharacterized protein n=1 Tax=Byssothecium circinans TaxID=147558 RepID=A0A6A5T5K7_9PLEO|nr:hypothetical protein CC80DRAFT_556558 [Byssothecium circinans]KAF1948235.1 hypothetical protein CC80DRAFT_586122 [Byssothecium circinans]